MISSGVLVEHSADQQNMDTAGDRSCRVLKSLEWVLLFFFGASLFGYTLPRAWHTLNTDFPNYYLAARIARDGTDTARLYEWRWLQRQKDHRDVDQPLVGLVPITPFSTLAVWPLTGLSPFGAKHVWLLLQLALLLPITIALRQVSGQPLLRIAWLAFACFPLHRNLLYGQYYILLLALLLGACWALQRERFAVTGILVGLAAATKIFPVLFLLYFLRKRCWPALSWATFTCAAAVGLSVAVFGWSVHRTYLELVLPWTLRGEVLPPYTLASESLSTLLHRLFVYEPQWNPHPWHAAPSMLALLQPLLQTVILAPALLLATPGHTSRIRTALEWSALLVASLTISTSPASYNFTLLLFPAAVLLGRLLPRRPLAALGVVLLFFAIAYPAWDSSNVDGLRAVLHVPRLHLLLCLTLVLYCTLGVRALRTPASRISNMLWAGAFASVCVISMFAAVRRQRALYADYAYRMPERSDVLMAAAPVQAQAGTARVAMLPGGYRILLGHSPVSRPGGWDELSFAHSRESLWIEAAGHASTLAPPTSSAFSSISGAESPALSADGQWIAYLREQQGRDRLFVRSLRRPGLREMAWTPAPMNVEEVTFAPDGSLIAAVAKDTGVSELVALQSPGRGVPLPLGDSRYPAVSPDGQWLAYSRLLSGAWNLWLLNRVTGESHRLTNAGCNQIEPSWESDSKTLLYASDCGRALWFTAVCRRKVVP